MFTFSSDRNAVKVDDRMEGDKQKEIQEGKVPYTFQQDRDPKPKFRVIMDSKHKQVKQRCNQTPDLLLVQLEICTMISQTSIRFKRD